MESFKVSVIIPVYNAAEYVENAVDSARNIESVAEIILIEDGSKDNSLEVCKELVNKYSNVRLIVHEGNSNKGAGPSRTLGLMSAASNFVSFLDADDFYLPNRFDKDKELFETDNTLDGVYNASSYLIDSDYARNRVMGRFKVNDPEKYLHTVREDIPSEDLFYYLLNGGKGHFNTNTITLRKSIFEKTGYFSDIKLHQDSHMWVRVALKGKLKAGNISSATSKTRVHINNRIKMVSRESVYLYYSTLYNDIAKDIKNKRDYSVLIKKVVSSRSKFSKNKLVLGVARVYFMLLHFITHPKDILKVNIKHLLS